MLIQKSSLHFDYIKNERKPCEKKMTNKHESVFGVIQCWCAKRAKSVVYVCACMNECRKRGKALNLTQKSTKVCLQVAYFTVFYTLFTFYLQRLLLP